VTKPTTINAITEIPAKIPRPIGRTEIFFPGIWKADWAEVEGAAEALSATVVPVLLAVDFVVVPVVDGRVCVGVVVGVCVWVVVGSGTEENPTRDTKEFEATESVGVGGDEVGDEVRVMVEGGDVKVVDAGD